MPEKSMLTSSKQHVVPRIQTKIQNWCLSQPMTRDDEMNYLACHPSQSLLPSLCHPPARSA